jgi:glycosyltransferase involved in cell wall biosynthesis
MDLNRYGWLDRLLYWIECRLSRLADVIIVNSHAGLEYAVNHGFPRGKMVVIHNGIDAQRFFPNQESRRRIREFLGIKDDEQVIGLVGRLDPMKGHETFLRAAAVLIGEQQGVRFICVGNGPEMYKRALIVLSEELGLGNKLIWLDTTDSPESIYNAFDIATSASYGEGFSNVIGEAMACGRPCVVTDVGDAKRIVGDTGYVVDPGNPSALVSAWQQALDAGAVEKTSRSQRARERVIEHFSLERLIEETARVLETAVKTGEHRTR